MVGKSQQFLRYLVFASLQNVSVSFLGLLEVTPFFCKQTVAVEEEFLNENLILRHLKLIIFAIIKSSWRSGIAGSTLTDKAIISLKETAQACILLCPLPEVNEKLQARQELDYSALNLLAGLVLLHEKENQMFVHRHVV